MAGGSTATTFLSKFKSYFNITTQNYYIATGTNLNNFIQNNLGLASTMEPTSDGITTINYSDWDNVVDNSTSASGKWIIFGLGHTIVSSTISIQCILYQTTGSQVTNNGTQLTLRVTNNSLYPAYPGGTYGTGGGTA